MDDTSRFSEPTIRKEFSTAALHDVDYEGRLETQLHCEMARINMGSIGGCNKYLEFIYAITGEVNIIRRNYRKWTEILGEFGGIMKVISSTVFFFYTLYNIKQVGQYLRGLIFKKEDKRNDFLRKKHKKGHMEVSYQQVVKELARSRSCIESLTQRLNNLEVIEKVLLTDEHKALIPLVLYKSKKEEMERELKAKTTQRENSENGFSNNKNQLGIHNNKILPENRAGKGAQSSQEDFYLRKYQILKDQLESWNKIQTTPTKTPEKNEEEHASAELNNQISNLKGRESEVTTLQKVMTEYIVGELSDLFREKNARKQHKKVHSPPPLKFEYYLDTKESTNSALIQNRKNLEPRANSFSSSSFQSRLGPDPRVCREKSNFGRMRSRFLSQSSARRGLLSSSSRQIKQKLREKRVEGDSNRKASHYKNINMAGN